MSWSDRIDLVIESLKWPCATMSAILLPLLVWGLFPLALRILSGPLNLVPLAIGTAGFIFVWRRWLGKSRIGVWLITLEHELTHALFAVMTGHTIVGFRASLRRGGEVRFNGRGNWLITAAPYFFPTAALVLLLLAFLMPLSGLPWRGLLLGVAIGYHIVSTYRETHRHQSDLKLLGSAFCWMVLPSANIAALALIVSFAHGNTDGIGLWIEDMKSPAAAALGWIRNQLTSR